MMPHRSLLFSVLLCLLPPAQGRQDPTESSPHTKDLSFRFYSGTAFKVLETFEEGNTLEANGSLGWE